MPGYVAHSVLRGGAPRLVASVVWTAEDADGVSGTRGVALAEPASTCADRIELVGQPFAERLAARLDGLCEAWSQMTFYLFDPESWR
jgi:hypothetical protein